MIRYCARLAFADRQLSIETNDLIKFELSKRLAPARGPPNEYDHVDLEFEESFDELPDDDIVVNCVAPIVDHRYVMSSNGHKEHRFVISTLMTLGDDSWEIEFTLSNRDPLQFRMLLGVGALGRHVIVAPYLSCCQGKISDTQLIKKYKR